MTIPASTYRVQLTPDRGFAALGHRVGYLRDLGVGHAYLSPILQATPGSTHGYDVVDHGHVNYELGGEPELIRMASELGAEGIGLVVDVVPNHMALPVPEHLNAAFWSVLRDGARSPVGNWFDIDWSADHPVVLPVLGQRIGDCLDAGEIVMERQGGPDGRPVLRYFDHVFPVRPGTEDLDLEELLGRSTTGWPSGGPLTRNSTTGASSTSTRCWASGWRSRRSSRPVTVCWLASSATGSCQD